MNWKKLPVIGALILTAAVFSIPNVGLAVAQMPAMTEVSGTYTNDDFGVEITFPDGWSGFEIEASGATIVTTSLGGMSESDPATMKTINMIIADKSQNKDPRDPASFSNDVDDCNDPTVQSRTVAGVQGIEATIECPSTSQKLRMVTVETSSNWIAVMYMAPNADFESELPSFDSAVASLTVQGAVNTEGSSGGNSGGNEDNQGNDGTNLGLELKSVIQSVTVKGKNMDMALKTTSTISEFKLEEQSKSLGFTVEGQTGTKGSTEIPIGKVLEGPYTVMIDGQTTTDFEVADEGTTDAVMTISYTHSTHDISISGTNVVPEFPVVMIGVIAALIGTVAVIGRTNLRNRR